MGSRTAAHRWTMTGSRPWDVFDLLGSETGVKVHPGEGVVDGFFTSRGDKHATTY